MLSDHFDVPRLHLLKACLTSVFSFSGFCINFVFLWHTYLPILVNGFRVLSRGDLGWQPLSCDIFMMLSSSSDIEWCWSVVVESYGLYYVNALIRSRLNDSVEQLVILRNYDGKVLQYLGPRIAKLPYRIVWTADWALMTDSRNMPIPSSTYMPIQVMQRYSGRSKLGACLSSLRHTCILFICKVILPLCDLMEIVDL